MSQFKEQWAQWLESIPQDQQAVLAELLAGTNAGKENTNGHATVQRVDNAHHTPERKVRVEREPIQDLLISDPPPYVDTLGLHAIYKSLAFESNILLKGPKGDGKSLSVISYAATINCPLVVVECSEDTKKYDLHGSQSLIGDETVFVLGGIPTAIDVANECGQCILLLEEVNALTPQVQKQLNAISDFRKMASIRQIGRTYTLNKSAKLWVVGTMNPSTYGGSYDLNEDLKSRFEEIEVTYPSTESEKQIIKRVCGNAVDDHTLDLLLRFVKETRQQATGYALSTRDLVRLVHTVAKLGLDTALQLVVCKFEGEDREVVTRRLASVFGPKNIKKYWGSSV